ncbi:hypothetical protein LTR10_023699 [Elasticomyces elasticus]|nr:hypothetical protein LTR10_023699 [Elasticomyces elasticus]KAK5183942.1 hypothetical protein LTR44_003447 [Eurotiomycetes sp. CCFEE 6388]
MSSEGRIIEGKLFVHATYEEIMFLPWFRPQAEFGPSDEPLPGKVMAVVAPNLNKFMRLGCSHAPRTLPAVVMDAMRSVSFPWSVQRKCQELLTCAICATNVRVSVIRTGTEHVKVRVKTWHCFGGLRDAQARTEGKDRMEDALFNFSYPLIALQSKEELESEP